MKNKIFTLLLTLVLICSAVFSVFAEVDLDNPPDPVEKPHVEDYHDNDKIKDYNEKATEYNNKVEEYNKAVDAEYENAVQSVDKQNAAGAQAQEESQQAHDNAVTQNEQAQKDADEQNANIDAANQQEYERVQAHNAAEDAKVQETEQYNQSESARVKRENQQRQEQYEKDVEQYNKDSEQYEIDKYYADRIIASGYESVAAYNDTVNSYLKTIGYDSIEDYTNARNTAIERNGNSETINIGSTYSIQEAEEKSGETLTVYLTHSFPELNLIYEVSFKIDKNDIITFNSFAPIVGATDEKSASFYYETDASHLAGYWYEGWSYCGRNANYYENDWQNGDTHIVSLKDGTPHYGDDPDIYMDYYYYWSPMPNYKNYNEPHEPTVPVLELETFTPITYTPQYEVYAPIAHVVPTLVEIPEVILWTIINYPDKRDYLSPLDLLDLFDIPVAPIRPQPQPQPQPQNPTSTITITQTTNNPTPAATPKTQTTTVPDADVPQVAAQGAWALVNLIATILGCIIALLALFIKKKSDNEEYTEDEESDIRKMRITKIASILIGIISIIVFILTEDMSLPMILTDKWTLCMILLLIIEVVNILIVKKQSQREEEDD